MQMGVLHRVKPFIAAALPAVSGGHGKLGVKIKTPFLAVQLGDQ